jgi:hypothetical protein
MLPSLNETDGRTAAYGDADDEAAAVSDLAAIGSSTKIEILERPGRTVVMLGLQAATRRRGRALTRN